MRVAVDATPLLGLPTGVGAFCQGALAALSVRPGVALQAYAVSWRRRSWLHDKLPAGVASNQRAMPARPLHALWARGDRPPVEWFIGATDVVHGTNFVVPPTRRAAAVVSVHDLTPLHHPELCNEATLAYPGLIRRALARGAWVHADSGFVAGEVVEAFGADPTRVRVVNPGVPALLALSPAQMAAAVRAPPARPGRAATSWPSGRPSHARTSLAWSAPSATWRRCTPTCPWCWPVRRGGARQALDAAIAASPARARIVRTGWVGDPELSALLGRAAVLAFPSLYEGFGLPPLEAMRAGVPVVATRAGSLPEVLGDASACLVANGDRDGLADAQDRCLADGSVRRDLVAAGTAWVARYSWASCGEGLERLYRDAVGDRHG